MTIRAIFCGVALAVLAGPALAQDVATALSAYFDKANTLGQKANDESEAALKAVKAGDRSGACDALRQARTDNAAARDAIQGVRGLLEAGKDLTPDTIQNGLKWAADNEAIARANGAELDSDWDAACVSAPAPVARSNPIDDLIEEAVALGKRAGEENSEAHDAYTRGNNINGCNAMERARQDHQKSYQDLEQARGMLTSDSSIPSSTVSQYIDAIDRVQSEAAGIGDSMAEIWRNRCQSN